MFMSMLNKNKSHGHGYGRWTRTQNKKTSMEIDMQRFDCGISNICRKFKLIPKIMLDTAFFTQR